MGAMKRLYEQQLDREWHGPPADFHADRVLQEMFDERIERDDNGQPVASGEPPAQNDGRPSVNSDVLNDSNQACERNV